MSDSQKTAVVAALTGAVVAVAGALALQALSNNKRDERPREERPRSSVLEREKRYEREVLNSRASTPGMVSRWTKPVVISLPGYGELTEALKKRVGSKEFNDDEGPTVSLNHFKSGDPDLKFNWQRIIGRKIVFLFDTVDQSRLFEQLALLQALQGFAVPDGDDKGTKWKTYVDQGKYSWGRASHITVVLPWYRPCQMERTSRWSLTDGKWTNAESEGPYLDVPTAQYLARLLATPGSVPPLPGPSASLDGMPLTPLWRPPLELLFVELHEEAPIEHSVSDLGATIRMERFVPYFLDKFKAEKSYAGKAKTFVLFPDHGAYSRYVVSVSERMKLNLNHILYIDKTRVGDKIEQKQTLFFKQGKDEPLGEKEAFREGDNVLIIDDFTNSGSTLFGAVNLVQKMAGSAASSLSVTIFVTHLVATYDPKVVENIKQKLTALGASTRFITTNTIPLTTDALKDHPQVEVLDLSDFIADLVQ